MGMPSKSKIIEYWQRDSRLLDEAGFLLDWGEPTCWACGEGWEGRYDIRNTEAPWSECMTAWNKAPLQRCHIVPRSLGGKDDPSNLFLMCKECHDLAPDTTNERLFFKWVKSQSQMKRTFAKMRQALQDLGIDTEDDVLLSQLTETIKAKEFQDWFKLNAGLHGAQLPPYGIHYSTSTLVAALLAYLERVTN